MLFRILRYVRELGDYLPHVRFAPTVKKYRGLVSVPDLAEQEVALSLQSDYITFKRRQLFFLSTKAFVQ